MRKLIGRPSFETRIKRLWYVKIRPIFCRSKFLRHWALTAHNETRLATENDLVLFRKDLFQRFADLDREYDLEVHYAFKSEFHPGMQYNCAEYTAWWADQHQVSYGSLWYRHYGATHPHWARGLTAEQRRIREKYQRWFKCFELLQCHTISAYDIVLKPHVDYEDKNWPFYLLSLKEYGELRAYPDVYQDFIYARLCICREFGYRGDLQFIIEGRQIILEMDGMADQDP